VEKLLEENVKAMRANSGQVVVMEPYSGRIIAMANYPTYDPNNFGDVYKMQEIHYDPGKGIPVFVRDDKGEYIKATKEQVADKSITKYKYRNSLGLGVYLNKVISELYEPGSVFKTLVMAAGLTPSPTWMPVGDLVSAEVGLPGTFMIW
jgi:cell division protein FtsI/penicillin-binding protein 2